MIDCYSTIYNKISTTLGDDINISSEYINTPSKFPYVSIVQIDNSIIPDKTTNTTEIAQIVFEINVYSDKESQKKSYCEGIMEKIDKCLFSMNFRRMSMIPVPNMENTKIYRIVARYRAATDGKFFYRR